MELIKDQSVILKKLSLQKRSLRINFVQFITITRSVDCKHLSYKGITGMPVIVYKKILNLITKTKSNEKINY